jgi:2'-phosphotransferase
VLCWKDVDLDLEEIIKPSRVKMAVHGTTLDAWKSIREYVCHYHAFGKINCLHAGEEGLSKMGRNHIHLAEGVGGTNIMSGSSTPS